MFELEYHAIPLARVRNHFSGANESGCLTGLGDAGDRTRYTPWADCQDLHILQTCLLSTSRASWKSPSFQENRPTLVRRTLRRRSTLLHGTRDAAESRKAARCSPPAPRQKNRPSRCWGFQLLPSATRGLYSAWHQSHPFPCQANSRGRTKDQCASPPNF